jgi:hypothetical protein
MSQLETVAWVGHPTVLTFHTVWRSSRRRKRPQDRRILESGSGSNAIPINRCGAAELFRYADEWQAYRLCR